MTKTKGTQTRDFILNQGFNYVSSFGFTDISIGKLASECKMSRSGLFAHFKSKEQLQVDILKFAEQMFIETVIDPTRSVENSYDKILMLCELWPNWVKKCSINVDGGCVFMSASFEFDHRDGPVRDYLLGAQKRLLKFFENTFKEGQASGVFKKEFSCEQLAFDFYSKYLGYHIYKNFLKDEKSKNYLEISLKSLLSSLKN